jgi:hypothetical protein
MKALFVMLALLLSGCLPAAGQNADKLFKNFAKEKNVELVNIGRLALTFAKPFAQELKGIASIQILNLEPCASGIKQRFSDEVGKLKNDGYELLMKAKDDEDKYVQILIKSKKDEIRELLIVTTGDEAVAVRVTGKIKLSDIQNLTAGY